MVRVAQIHADDRPRSSGPFNWSLFHRHCQVGQFLQHAVDGLFSTIAAAISFALARWDGATIPAAFTRSGVTFAACLTLCLAALSTIDR